MPWCGRDRDLCEGLSGKISGWSNIPRNTQHLPDNKTPTLAADDVHFQGRMIEPGLDVKPEEARRNGVLQVGDLHCVAVLVAAQKLKT